jgi:hypothetical protein
MMQHVMCVCVHVAQLIYMICLICVHGLQMVDAAERKLLELLAKTLGVELRDAVDPFAVLEAALTHLGVKSVLPIDAKPVGIRESLDPGSHIVVRAAGSNAVFHHGIYIGPYTPEGAVGEDEYVIDMYGAPDEGKRGARLRLRPMSKFINMKGFPELAVVRYAADTPAVRERTVALALMAQSTLGDCTGLYNLLGCNCNHFATWCRTMRWVCEDLAAATEQTHAATRRLPTVEPGHGKMSIPIHAR